MVPTAVAKAAVFQGDPAPVGQKAPISSGGTRRTREVSARPGSATSSAVSSANTQLLSLRMRCTVGAIAYSLSALVAQATSPPECVARRGGGPRSLP